MILDDIEVSTQISENEGVDGSRIQSLVVILLDVLRVAAKNQHIMVPCVRSATLCTQTVWEPTHNAVISVLLRIDTGDQRAL